MQLRPDALRLLDRVDAVVVDPRALATDELRVGRFRDVAQADRAEVWQWAQSRLEAGELSAGWHRVAPAFGGAARNGRARGQVLVYRRHDPRAYGVLAEIRRAGAQAVSLNLDQLGDLRSSFDDLHEAGSETDIDTALAGAVETLQRDGRTVAVLSVDAPQALGAADLAIGLLGRGGGIPWQADVLAVDLAAVWRLVHATPAGPRSPRAGPRTGDRRGGRGTGERILAGPQRSAGCRAQGGAGRGLACDDTRAGPQSARRSA
ncbi:ATPase P [Mycolicibacterium conceptionense]|uniref:ATPase P n=1 Tax=Mycolicibacterium conceptionense TaxID=451644 RepID=A0A0U1CX28_9MYCO|nr:ATPase P [Mycolicibacterium conceptionense]